MLRTAGATIFRYMDLRLSDEQSRPAAYRASTAPMQTCLTSPWVLHKITVFPGPVETSKMSGRFFGSGTDMFTASQGHQ